MVAAIARAYPGAQFATLRSRLVPHYGALTGSASVQGNAGTYSSDQVVTGAVGSVSVTGMAGTLQTGPFLQGATGSVTVTGNAPPYWAGLAGYEVRALSGSYAPSIGETTFWDAVPVAWQTGDPSTGNPRRVITAWNGGVYDPATGILWVTGGGHDDSAFPAWVGYDLNDYAGRPGGFALLAATLSDLADVPARTPAGDHFTYSDGLPGSVHTYNGIVRVGANDLIRYGGSIYSSGNWARQTWRLNASDGTYTAMADGPAINTGSNAWYDSASGKTLVFPNNQARFDFHRVSADTWKGITFFADSGLVAPQDGTLVMDTTRNNLIALGGTRSAVYSIDWAAETVTQLGDITWTGDTTIVGLDGLSAFYYAADDAVWVLGGNNISGAGAAGYAAIARIDAADLATPASVAVVETTLTGDTIGIDATTQGSFGRFAWIPDRRQIVLISRAESPPYVIQLPDAA